jgi:hypothetical protein
MSDRHEVGQVVYVISRKEGRVYPVLVVEETVRRTLEGTITSYMVRLPDRKGTVVPLETISERVYASHNELRDYMITAATRSINTMVDSAVEIGRVLAPAGAAPATNAESAVDDAGVVVVEMPDGTKARVKMPDQPVQG